MADPLLTDRALQDAYRAVLRTAGGAGHLDEASWQELIGGGLQQSQRDELFDHVVACEKCSQIWRALLDLDRGAEADGLIPARDTGRSAPWHTRTTLLALAASLVLGVASIVLMRWGAVGPSGSDTTINRGVVIQDVTDAAYDPASRSFNWAPVAGAAQYRVSVFATDGTPMWTATVGTTRATWPDGPAPAAGAYSWRVEAINAGEVIARTRLLDFNIAR